jgi:Zn-dependent alcohol dehydrogenase
VELREDPSHIPLRSAALVGCGVPTGWGSAVNAGRRHGMMSPSSDMPRLLQLHEQGRLELDSLVTRTYTLDEISLGYDDLHSGTNMRGVIEFP